MGRLVGFGRDLTAVSALECRHFLPQKVVGGNFPTSLSTRHLKTHLLTALDDQL